MTKPKFRLNTTFPFHKMIFLHSDSPSLRGTTRPQTDGNRLEYVIYMQKLAHDILLHRGDIRLRKRETRKRETSAHLEPRYYEADSTLNKVKAQEVDPQFQAGLPDCLLGLGPNPNVTP